MVFGHLTTPQMYQLLHRVCRQCKRPVNAESDNGGSILNGHLTSPFVCKSISSVKQLNPLRLNRNNAKKEEKQGWAIKMP